MSETFFQFEEVFCFGIFRNSFHRDHNKGKPAIYYNVCLRTHPCSIPISDVINRGQLIQVIFWFAKLITFLKSFNCFLMQL